MQRLNSFTNNKNNVNLKIEKNLMLRLSVDNANKNKDSNNGFIDIAAFKSGDLVQRSNQGSIGKMDFGMSPNVNN